MRRPDNIDLAKANHGPSPSLTSPRSNFYLDLPSPRVGQIPPALSPLDAFAQQSRMLAKRFQDSQLQGRRISRLEHAEVANQFGKGQIYHRPSLDDSDFDHDIPEENDLPLLHSHIPSTPRQDQQPPARQQQMQYQQQSQSTSRAMSQYPIHSAITPSTASGTPSEIQGSGDGYFGFHGRRAISPEPLDVPAFPTRNADSPRLPSLTGSGDSIHSSTPRTNTDESTHPSQRSDQSLAPPGQRISRQPRSPRSNMSIRSVLASADDDYGQRTSALNELAPPRKVSNASAISSRRSPMSPEFIGHTARSPSNQSDASFDNQQFRRPSCNFSRPLSGGSIEQKQWSEGRPSISSRRSRDSNASFEFPVRKASLDKARSPLRQESTSTNASREPPIDRNDDSQINTPSQGAPSYIYSKYALPRGRTVDQNELDPRAIAQMRSPLIGAPSNIHPMSAVADRGRTFRHALDLDKSRSRSADGQAPPTPRFQSYHRPSMSSPTVTTPRSQHTHMKSPSEEIVNMSAEQHLEEGIQCHKSGSLSKSTYHLRLAARGGLPTAMLLYALACRHGWGMRASQTEGMFWLKKAVDSSSINLILNDKSLASPDTTKNPASALTPTTAASLTKSDGKRDASFALAVYELGMSYMNGWGTAKDKVLALRCFEIASAWGDCDALAEAGFCYTEGVGAKKDLKKAAGYYRRAAEGGMSMAGNSW